MWAISKIIPGVASRIPLQGQEKGARRKRRRKGRKEKRIRQNGKKRKENGDRPATNFGLKVHTERRN